MGLFVVLWASSSEKKNFLAAAHQEAFDILEENREVLDALVDERIADHKRIYVSGFSSGGFMTWSLLSAFPDRFAAAAPMSSSMTEAQIAACKPRRAVPLVVFAGTADRIVRYDGALRGTTRIVSIPETLEFWRRHHGCAHQSVTDVPHLDPTDPTRGLVFDGRLAEDFKLGTGTWVSAGALRAQFVDHCAPLVRDAVIAGADREDIAALVFPDVEACRRLAGLPADATTAAVLAHEKVRAEFKRRLDTLAAQSKGSSTRICRAVLMDEPPSLDAGEATDKGSINQRAVLARRVALVEQLYAAALPAHVISIERD